MTHITVPVQLPGIAGLLASFPDTAAPLAALADSLLHTDGGLSRADREIIAAAVSRGNGCLYCYSSHAAVARVHLGDNAHVVDNALECGESAVLSPLLQHLLAVAEEVRRGGQYVTDKAVERARAAGASDRDIHDTVLIAAAFCMFNRYVDGLRTWLPADPAEYDTMGSHLAEHGYSSVA